MLTCDIIVHAYLYSKLCLEFVQRIFAEDIIPIIIIDICTDDIITCDVSRSGKPNNCLSVMLYFILPVYTISNFNDF